ncbi:MAG: redoxin domain-containing protein [Acidobacteriota bacterium]|jgi:tetratricopeptide (TPR) repeat protein
MKRRQCLLFIVMCCITIAGSGASQYLPHPDAKTEFDKGRAALKIGYTTGALQSFRKALELDPDYVDALTQLVTTAKAMANRSDPASWQRILAGETTLRAVSALYTAKAALAPKSAVYQWALGLLDNSQTQEAAERYFRKAVALDAGFAKGYQSLASTLIYRGDIAGAREAFRKAHELQPDDLEMLAEYARQVIEIDLPLCSKLTDGFIMQFPRHASGADLLSRMSSFEGDLAVRIGMLERLKSLYSPIEYEVTEWYMRFLFDAYHRTDPPRALGLAQEMTTIIPAGSEAGRDWQEMAKYEQSMVIARTLMDRKSYKEAADMLNKAELPYLISPDPQALLQAEAADMAGNTARACQILTNAMAAQPSDALKPALAGYAAKLKKTPAQVEEEVWVARLKKARMLKDFNLPGYRDGKRVRLSGYRGRVVLLTYWHPGDVNCRDDLPRLQKMLDKYGPQGLTVVTINVNPEEDAIAAVLMGRYGFVSLRAPYQEWALDVYKVDRAPINFLIDREGRALFMPTFWGFDPQHTFELEVEAMLARKSKN